MRSKSCLSHRAIRSLLSLIFVDFKNTTSLFLPYVTDVLTQPSQPLRRLFQVVVGHATIGTLPCTDMQPLFLATLKTAFLFPGAALNRCVNVRRILPSSFASSSFPSLLSSLVGSGVRYLCVAPPVPSWQSVILHQPRTTLRTEVGVGVGVGCGSERRRRRRRRRRPTFVRSFVRSFVRLNAFIPSTPQDLFEFAPFIPFTISHNCTLT